VDVDVVEIDDAVRRRRPRIPSCALSFNSSTSNRRNRRESQAVGAATQQAMALSQRFLPCMPVQFDDFALAATSTH
jgi:hypothetical protein